MRAHTLVIMFLCKHVSLMFLKILIYRWGFSLLFDMLMLFIFWWESSTNFMTFQNLLRIPIWKSSFLAIKKSRTAPPFSTFSENPPWIFNIFGCFLTSAHFINRFLCFLDARLIMRLYCSSFLISVHFFNRFHCFLHARLIMCLKSMVIIVCSFFMHAYTGKSTY